MLTCITHTENVLFKEFLAKTVNVIFLFEKILIALLKEIQGIAQASSIGIKKLDRQCVPTRDATFWHDFISYFIVLKEKHERPDNMYPK